MVFVMFSEQRHASPVALREAARLDLKRNAFDSRHSRTQSADGRRKGAGGRRGWAAQDDSKENDG